MNDGFVKVAAGSVATTVADVVANVQEIKARITEARNCASPGTHAAIYSFPSACNRRRAPR